MPDTINTSSNLNILFTDIGNTHPEYNFWKSIWKKNQDCVDGQISIKTSIQSEAYLPKLAGHRTDNTNELYQTYKQYAVWYNGTGRTVEGITGLVFRKDPTTNIPDVLKIITKDIDFKGQTLKSFAKKVLRQTIIKNKVGVLVDFPIIEKDFTSLLEYEKSGVRPYAQIYEAENILNWRESNNKTSFISLYETEYVKGEDEFESVLLERIRILELNSGIYQQTVYEKKDITSLKKQNDIGWILKGTVIPKINGVPLNYIPFCVITKDGMSWDLDYSVINDLGDMNIAHFRNSASYENALILTGNPTPVLTNYNSENDNSIVLGSSQAIILGPGAEWGFLTIGSDGLSELRLALEKKEEYMSKMGGKIIATENKDAETAETASIHKEGEQSVLANIADNISEGIEKILTVMGQWIGLSENEIKSIEYKLNKDFKPTKMTPQEMTALLEALTAGKISEQEYFENLKKGEIIDGDKTFEEHNEEIENNPIETNIDVQKISDRVDREMELEEANGKSKV